MVGADCWGFRGYDLQEGSGLQDEKADIGGGLLVPVYEKLLDGYFRNDLDGFGSWWRVYSSLPHISHALTSSIKLPVANCRYRFTRPSVLARSSSRFLRDGKQVAVVLA